ncbi:MAG: hypothetical protein OEY03_04735, partial [Rhizobacter sp.]|nr:hypothetical protein [Rhizobacter sp.]
AAAFFAGAFLAAAFFFAGDFLAASFFFAGAFFAATFFFAGAFFAASFFFAGAFFAAAFLAGDFFAAFLAGAFFFAVAITFLLDQVEKKLPSTNSCRYLAAIHRPESAQEGRPGTMNRVVDRAAALLRRCCTAHES